MKSTWRKENYRLMKSESKLERIKARMEAERQKQLNLPLFNLMQLVAVEKAKNPVPVEIVKPASKPETLMELVARIKRENEK